MPTSEDKATKRGAGRTVRRAAERVSVQRSGGPVAGFWEALAGPWSRDLEGVAGEAPEPV